MIVWRSDAPLEERGEGVDNDCLFCGKGLSYPFVMWAGLGAKLFLHPPCAVDLFLRLQRDVWEVGWRPGDAAAEDKAYAPWCQATLAKAASRPEGRRWHA